MPKRLRSDDEENLTCLVKNHISDREVNNGVLKDLNMRTVYQKTLALLFRGQKNVANNNAESLPGCGVQSKDKQPYRQLCLSNSGSCIKANDQLSAISVGPVGCCSCIRPSCRPTGRNCQICSGTVGSSCLLTCSNCLSSSCGSCDGVRTCSSCGIMFCRSCAFFRGSGCICSLCK